MGSLNRYTSSGGNFLSKADVPQPITATIVGTGEHVFKEDEPAKLTLTLAGIPKRLVCNKTMSKLLATIFDATEEEQLIGKVIEVFIDENVADPRGCVVGALRLRLPINGQQQPQPATQQATMQQPVMQQATMQQPQQAATQQQPTGNAYSQQAPPQQQPPDVNDQGAGWNG